MDWYRTLYERYEDMNGRWSATEPRAQPEALDTSNKCLALWTRGDFHLNLSILNTLFELAGEIPHVNYVSGQGQLHHTFFQLKTFPCYPGDIDEIVMAAVPTVFQNAMALLPPYHIEFRGLVLTATGIALRGFPRRDYTSVRNTLRKAVGSALVEPHKQDIYHVTVLRWLEEPSADIFSKLVGFVEAHKETNFGVLWPASWEFGYGTWTMEDCTVLAKWKAPPAPHILHRGNTFGPSHMENNPVVLEQLLEDGWDVEVDLWVCDNEKLWLGHDRPEYLLAGSKLLEYPGVWIHCKNTQALVWASQNHTRLRYFSHDKDTAVLVSDGTIWCYPGVKCEGPARAVYVLSDGESGKGICVDEIIS